MRRQARYPEARRFNCCWSAYRRLIGTLIPNNPHHHPDNLTSLPFLCSWRDSNSNNRSPRSSARLYLRASNLWLYCRCSLLSRLYLLSNAQLACNLSNSSWENVHQHPWILLSAETTAWIQLYLQKTAVHYTMSTLAPKFLGQPKQESQLFNTGPRLRSILSNGIPGAAIRS